MKFNITKILRGLSKIVLVLAGVFLLGLLSYTVYLSVKYKPMKVRVTNITGSSATVSWVTDTPMPGVVYYKEKDSFLPGPLAWIGSSKAWDDRDISYAETKCVEDFNNSVDVTDDFSVDMDGYDCNNIKVEKIGKYYTHHITLKNLDEQKEYFFRVGDGLLGWNVDISDLKTFALAEDVKEPMPVFGRIGNTDGDYSNDSIIYVQFKDGSESVDSEWVSGVTNNDGGWYVDASIATDPNGNPIDLELSQDMFVANAQFQNYSLSDDNEWILGYFNGAYPDILVEKKIQASIFNPFVFNSYAECKYGSFSGCSEEELISHKADWGYGNITKALAEKTNGGNINVEVLNKVGLGGSATQIAGNLQVITGKGITAKEVQDIEDAGGKVEAKKSESGWSVGREDNKVTGVKANGSSGDGDKAQMVGSIIRGYDGKVNLVSGGNTYSQEMLKKLIGENELNKIISDNCTESTCNVQVFTYAMDFIDLLDKIKSDLENVEDPVPNPLGNSSQITTWSDFVNKYALGPSVNTALLAVSNNVKEVESVIVNGYPVEAIKNGYDIPGFEYELKTVTEQIGYGQTIDREVDSYIVTEWSPDVLRALLSDSVSYTEKMNFLKKANESSTLSLGEQPASGGVYSISPDGKSLLWTSNAGVKKTILNEDQLKGFQLEIKEETFVAMQTELNTESTSGANLLPTKLANVIDDLEEAENIDSAVAENLMKEYQKCFEAEGCDLVKAQEAVERIESFTYQYDSYNFITQEDGKVIIGEDPGHEYWEARLRTLENKENSLKAIEDGTASHGPQSILNIFEPSKAYAQETSADDSYAMYLPEYGMFSMQLGDFEFDKETSNGNTIYLFYVETNGEEGLQIPEDLENPGLNDDMMLRSSAYQINYSKESTVQELEVKKGVNLLSFDFMTVSENDNSYSASDIILEGAKRGVDIEYVTYFDGGRWMNGYRCDDDSCQGTDFDILPGKGYLVYSGSEGKIYIPAYDLLSSIPVAYSQGWNLVGIHGYSKKYTARTLIDSINSIDGLNANNVSWWPTSKSKYEGLQVEDNQEYGLDFPISSTNGYFVRINEFKPESSDCKSIIWHDGGELNGSCGNSKTIF